MASPATHPAHSSSTAVFSPPERITPSHKRTYQACIPCRRRKVRCDLGPVDDPHEPPCVRCRRESKDCYFSATRRKRRADGDLQEEDDDYTIRNRRRKSVHLQQNPIAQTRRSVSSSSTPPLDGYDPEHGPARRSDSLYTDPVVGNDEPGQDQEVTNETAAALFQTPINTPGDALHLLLEASGRSEDIQFQQKAQSTLSQSPRERKSNTSSQFHFARPEPIEPPVDQGHLTNLDPAIASDGLNNPSTDSSREALRIWSRLRFVRAGWLTAKEAFFYEFLSPLTPVSPPDFRLISTNATLVDEEPILAVTILTISARYKKLAGPGGQTRSFMIHDRLWTYLQNMITRMFWGQEQFGGGFCGAGSRRGAQKSMEKGVLRSLGTIESLLLLSEFHPRSMHFPSSDDADEIFACPDGDAIDEGGPPIGESTFAAGWTEPALRSDRMCWSLIGTAYTLAYELGIFGNYADGTRSVDSGIKRRSGSLDRRLRADRIERLLFIYVTQTSGRLGFSSAFPGHSWDADLACLEQSFAGDYFRRGFVHCLQSKAKQAIPQDLVETIQQSWAEMASIMKACNATLFCSKEKTTELIQSGEYIGLIQQMQPVLASWLKKFQSLDVPKYSRIILLIEFEYGRVYINSLALQAVLEQWTANGGQDYNPQNPGASSASLVGSYKKNEYYIKETIDASRSLLRHVVNGLFPDDNLKHAPVRTHMRILSGAMFLLKTFALGAKEDEVATSLRLLDETIKALRTSVVDDVHLCLRIADLLEGLTSSIRHKFVRLAVRNARPSNHANGLSAYPSTPLTTSGQVTNAIPFVYQHNRNMTMPDPLAGISTDRIDLRENALTIMPPRDTTYVFPSNYNIGTPNSATGSFDYQQQLYPANSSISEEDWLTLDLNPLLSDTVNSAFGTGGDGNVDWFGNFGPEMRENLEVLGRFFTEQPRADAFEGGALGFG
ncbi:hypothetical protein MMC07_001156 [Pseudocyphellaria aurata]|nr:hypothetical protein [Pseudocyphellaria aurata]